VLAEEAARIGAPAAPVRERLRVEAIQRYRPFVDPPERRQRVWLRPPTAVDVPGVETESEVYEIALSGRHQAENLALAVAAAEALRELGWERMKRYAVKKGVRACRWPGRTEEVVLPEVGGDGARVLFDVAHNPGGAASLADFLETLREPVDLVFGVLEDKEPGPMLARLAPRAHTIHLTRPSGERGMPLEDLRARVSEALPEDVLAGGGGRRKGTGRGRKGERTGVELLEEPVPARALRRALDGAEGRPVVVCGSIVLVGELRAELRRRYGVPEPAVEIKLGP
jgi:dihydrofolate synthase/folylpolyglutamate synthase